MERYIRIWKPYQKRLAFLLFRFASILPPCLALGYPLWTILMIYAFRLTPYMGAILVTFVWICGLIATIMGSQTIFSVLYYIAFVVVVIASRHSVNQYEY